METYLVTGSSGLIGDYLCRHLLAQGKKLVRVSRTRGKGNSDAGGVCMDLGGGWDPARLPRSVDHVIYLAQSPGYRDLPNGVTDVIGVNTLGAARMAEYARDRGAKSFVYASTGSVYRAHGAGEFITEASPILEKPTGIYAWSKLCAEAALGEFGNEMAISILRFFFVYGRGGDRRMLIPRLAARIGNGETLDIQGENGFTLTPTYAADAARACFLCAEGGRKGVLNVAGSEVVTFRALCNRIGEVVGRSPEIRVGGDFPKNFFAVDNSALLAQTGMEMTPLNEGLRESFGGGA